MDFITTVLKLFEGLTPEAKDNFIKFLENLEEQENKNNKEDTTK